MYNVPIRRICAVAGALAVISLVIAGPASAHTTGGTPWPSSSPTVQHKPSATPPRRSKTSGPTWHPTSGDSYGSSPAHSITPRPTSACTDSSGNTSPTDTPTSSSPSPTNSGSPSDSSSPSTPVSTLTIPPSSGLPSSSSGSPSTSASSSALAVRTSVKLLTSSCYTVTVEVTSSRPTVLRIIDSNGGVPFSPGTLLLVQAGITKHVINLDHSYIRQGTSDDVQLWTSGSNTVTLLDASVPVNCSIAVDDIVTQAKIVHASTAISTGSLDAAPVASSSGLASTGVRTAKLIGAGVALLGSGTLVLYGARRPRRRTH